MEALPLLQIARKGFEWVNESSKWSCKIGECNETYVTKWLLIAYLKKVYQLIIKKGNHGCPSTHEGSPQCQNHTTTNACIMNDAQFILQQNEQKAIVHAWTKVVMEWDHFEKAIKEHQIVKKPPLVKLDCRDLLEILCNSRWGVDYILWDAFIINWEGWGSC